MVIITKFYSNYILITDNEKTEGHYSIKNSKVQEYNGYLTIIVVNRVLFISRYYVPTQNLVKI